MPGPWRLLLTPPAEGPTNMAIDEALLRARIAGAALPTLRLYGWAPPAVSLGYGQAAGEGIDLAACRRLGIGLVRRPTGGSALLHEGPAWEVTYSVVARTGDFPGAEDLLETYRVLGGALAAGLRRLGIPAELVPLVRGRARGPAPVFCFARTGAWEVAVGGRKLVGSAQRRQAGAFLQHGAILLDADPARLGAVFPGRPEPLAGMTTAAAVLGRPVARDAVVAALVEAFGAALGARLLPGALSEAETQAAGELAAGKYATAAWTFEGRTGAEPAARRGC